MLGKKKWIVVESYDWTKAEISDGRDLGEGGT